MPDVKKIFANDVDVSPFSIFEKNYALSSTIDGKEYKTRILLQLNSEGSICGRLFNTALWVVHDQNEAGLQLALQLGFFYFNDAAAADFLWVSSQHKY